MSVTNVAESAHAALVADEIVCLFEHYPADGTEDPEHFDQIAVSEGHRLPARAAEWTWPWMTVWSSTAIPSAGW